MEAAESPETLIHIYETAWRHDSDFSPEVLISNVDCDINYRD